MPLSPSDAATEAGAGDSVGSVDSVGGNSVGGNSVGGRVREVIELIRPAVQADGGDVELVGVDVPEGGGAGVARIRFHGACVGCPSSTMTLRHGIERHVTEAVPEIGRVVPVD